MSGSLPDGTCLRVTAGSPTAPEIAALMVALDAAPAPATPAEAEPAWARAARREAVGGPPVVTPADLRRLR